MPQRSCFQAAGQAGAGLVSGAADLCLLFAVLVIMCAGDPDIIDAIVFRLMECGAG